MWKYIGNELGLEGIIGVPNRDMTDEEFKKASAKIARKFPGQPLNSLEKSGLWIREEEEKVENQFNSSFRSRGTSFSISEKIETKDDENENKDGDGE